MMMQGSPLVDDAGWMMRGGTVTRRRWVRRAVGLTAALWCAALAAGCGDSSAGAPGVGVEVPVSASHDAVEPTARALLGVVRDFVTGEALPDVVISADPALEVVRTTEGGEFVLQEGVAPGTWYTLTAELDGYARGGAVVLSSETRSRNVDMVLRPLTQASVLVATPPAVVFTGTRRVATVFLENPTARALSWELKGAPEWLGIFSSARVVYQGNPEVMELWVEGERLAGSPDSDVFGELVVSDEDGRELIVPLLARVLDPTRLTLEAVGATTDGARAEVEALVRYDGQPVEGERVRCVVSEEAPFVDVTVEAMSGADGVARCAFSPTAAEAEMPVGLVVTAAARAYPDVPSVSITLDSSE